MDIAQLLGSRKGRSSIRKFNRLQKAVGEGCSRRPFLSSTGWAFIHKLVLALEAGLWRTGDPNVYQIIVLAASVQICEQ